MYTVFLYTSVMHILIQVKTYLLLFVTIVSLLTIQSSYAAGGFETPVRVEPARRMVIAPVHWVPGTVIGKYDSRIAAEVEARIEKILDIGEYVEQGDELAVLDNTTLRMELDEARAALMPLEARLEYLTSEAERLNRLAEKNNAARSRLEEIQSSRDEAKGEIMVRKKRIALARDRYERSIVKAPFTGVITERYKGEGEWVESGEEILRVVNIDNLEIQARVSTRHIQYLNIGDELDIRDGENIFKGTIQALVPVGDNLSRLYEIRIHFSNPDWMVGHAVEVAIPADKPREVIAVSTDALVIRENTIRIFRINDKQTAEMLIVDTGISNDNMIEILGPLQEGDRVVTRGNERLRPQQKVTIQEGVLPH